MWAIRNPRGGISVSDRKGALVELGEPIELTEVRRCATCAHYDSSRENPGRCTLLSFAVPVRGHCHMHDPLPTTEQSDQELRANGVDVDSFEARLRDKIKTVREKTNA
jgi:hypothetical protein